MRINVNTLAWTEDCLKWRGEVLTGKFAHWCFDWDGLPVDETCIEFSCCGCYDETEEITRLKEAVSDAFERGQEEDK